MPSGNSWTLPGLGLGVVNPALYQPGYHLFNASLRWDVKSTGFAVTGGVDNLTNKKYRTYGDFQDSFGMTDEIFSRGRQWYVTLSYGF